MADFGMMIASSVVKVVTAKLASKLSEEIGLQCGFKNDMKDMKHNLELIQAVLEDTEMKSFTDKGTCLWVKNLKSAAYDIEDMMCDFEIEFPSNKEEGGLVNRLKQIKRSAMMGKKRCRLVRQMKNMRKRLSGIAAERSKFGLSTGTSLNKERIINERETFSAVNENTILGRDDEKAVLMRYLKQSNDGENAFIIAIVGLGGIGKTTLARLIYNDKWVGAFNNRAWVYVSMEFDLKKIAINLLESFGGTQQEVSSQNLETITKNLRGKISGKKYFIVLDDLWEEDGGKLDRLKDMLNGGINGSKIIVTTRSENVAKLIGAAETHKMDVLSSDLCWELFSQKAFVSVSEKNDNEVGGREIVKKCGGIPLAVIAVGHTVRVHGIAAVLQVQDNKIWELKEPSDGSSSDDIMSSLKLSYYFMPSILRLCFVYFSIYSKGYSISKEELIHQWIALGFIPTDDGMSLEMRGEWYVNNLLSMSFLQPALYYPELKMHDLVHDLARSVIRNEILFLDAEKDDTNLVVDHGYRYASLLNFNALTNVRRTLLSKIRTVHDHGHIFPEENKIKDFYAHIFLDTKYLRVLDIRHDYHDDGNLNTFPDSIGELKQLRYLYATIGLEDLPESFGNLINLRYLYLPNNYLEMLPKPVGKLTNLQFLNLDSNERLEVLHEPFSFVSLEVLSLKHCYHLRKLPDSICTLTKKLHTLDISGCDSFSITPSFVGMLSRLRKLEMKVCPYPINLSNLPASIKEKDSNNHGLPTNVVLVKTDIDSDLFDILELHKLDELETRSNSLNIFLLENVRSPEYLAKASCCTVPNLRGLKLHWSYTQNLSAEERARDKQTLKNLMHYLDLKLIKTLNLAGYSAPSFPGEMNIEYFLHNFGNLSKLCLEKMEKCEHLPPLGRLPNLSALKLRKMPNLKKIDEALFGGREAFKSLLSLHLDSLVVLEEWPNKYPGSDNELVLTSLVELHVVNCPKLRFEPCLPPNISSCFIKNSPHVLSLRETQSSTCLTKTSKLVIESCEFDSGTLPDIIQGMTSLKRLFIWSCSGLTVLPEWLGKLTSLKYLMIQDCNSLDYVPLSIFDLPSIMSIIICSNNQTLVQQWSTDDSDRFNISDAFYFAKETQKREERFNNCLDYHKSPTIPGLWFHTYARFELNGQDLRWFMGSKKIRDAYKDCKVIEFYKARITCHPLLDRTQSRTVMTGDEDYNEVT